MNSQGYEPTLVLMKNTSTESHDMLHVSIEFSTHSFIKMSVFV